MFHNDCFQFLAENASRRMNKFFTLLIRERIHYNNAKLKADEENWHFQTQITLVSL